MTTICLIRHGETDWNTLGRIQGREDTELNENGLRQAEQCAAILKPFHCTAVISSPLRRAAKTAEIIADALGIGQYKIMDQMTEREFGEISGLGYEARKKISERVGGIENVKGIERFDDLCRRAMGALEQIAGDYCGRTVAVVAHGGIINSILWCVSGGKIGTGKTVLQNGSVSVVRKDNGVWLPGEYNLASDRNESGALKTLFL